MQAGIAQLKKLSGKDIREICLRGRQEIAKFGERVLGFSTGEMSDEAFYYEVRRQERNGSGMGTAQQIAERIQSSVRSEASAACRPIFPSLSHRREIADLMKSRFAIERQTLLDRARRAASARFDLLGIPDLSFGNPIDWHLEPTTGKRTPLEHWSLISYLDPGVAGDKKITWELNRHQHFITLGQAYWMTDDERYAEVFVRQAESWMDRNPPKRGINWASNLEVAFRCISWLWALNLFSGSPHLTPRFTLRILKYLVCQGRHIESYLSQYFSPNTHLTGEALGLYYLGASLPELSRSDVWREIGLRILIEQLPIHARADGVYFEQSSYYHRYTADFYTHLLVISRAVGISLPLEVEEKLSRLLDHLMWITKPEGTSPLIGDDDGGRLIKLSGRGMCDFRDTLAVGAALFGRQDWKHVAGPEPVEVLWMLGPSGLAHFDQIIAKPPETRAHAFPYGGYYVIRDGWESDSGYALIDCGPHGSLGGGHAHADALSIEFAAGRTWLVDPGTFTYTGSASERDEFRATSAHNTVTIDDQSQSIPAGPFSWSHTANSSANIFVAAEDLAYFEGSHDGYHRLPDPVTHTRSVLFVNAEECQSVPAYLVIRDLFTARRRHNYKIHYHFPAGCSVLASGNRVKVKDGQGGELNIAAFGEAEPHARVREGWISRVYGQRDPALVLTFEASATGPNEFISFINPRGASANMFQTGRIPPGDGRPSHFTMAAGKLMDSLITSDGDTLSEGSPLKVRGSLGWTRFADGALASAFLVRGRSLEVDGFVQFHSETPVEYCAIRFDSGPARAVSLSLRGTSRFELALEEPVAMVSVNKTIFTTVDSRKSLTFIETGSGWEIESSSRRR